MREILDLGRIGRNLINTALHTRGTYAVLTSAVARLSALRTGPTRVVFYKQVYFTGVEALSKITAIGLLIGIVIITQVTNIVGLNAVLIGRVLVWTVVRELGPLLVAIIVIARSCSAVASELGAMRVNREVDYLFSVGIDPVDYLVVPRVAGISLCVFLLSFYFQVVSIAGGLALSSVFIEIQLLRQAEEIFAALGVFEIFVSLVKSLVFGLLVSASCCYHGLRVGASVTEVPQATTAAVMQGLFLIFVFDGVITVVSYI